MTDQVTPAQADQSEPAIKPVRAATAGKSTKPSNGLVYFFLFILFLLILAVAGGAAWFGWQLWQEREEAAQKLAEISRLQSELSNTRGQLAKLESATQSNLETESNLQSRLEEQQNSLRDNIDNTRRLAAEVATIKGQQQTDWMINELAHFTTLAQRRIELTQDARGALALLQHASEVAGSIAEPGMSVVRKAIESDLQALNSVQRLDVDKLFLKLEVVGEKLPDLALPPKLFKPTEQPEAEAVPDYEDTWINKVERGLGLIVQSFQQSYRIQKLDTAITPLLAPEERVFLQQNLTLLLEQAKLGLLRAENGVYKNSLTQMKQWIEQFYRSDTIEAQAVLQTLDALLLADVSPSVPSINDSIDAVKAFEQQWRETKHERALLKLKMQQQIQQAQQQEAGEE